MNCEIEFSNNFESAKYHKLIFYTKNMLVQLNKTFGICFFLFEFFNTYPYLLRRTAGFSFDQTLVI